MLENKWKCGKIAVLAMAVFVMEAVPAYASGKSVQINIPVKAESAVDIIIKAADDSEQSGRDIPMPEDTTVHVDAGSGEMIGPITYRSADNYSYTVSGGGRTYEVNVQTTYDSEGNLQAAVWCVLADGTKDSGNALSFGTSDSDIFSSASSSGTENGLSGSSVSGIGNVETGDAGKALLWAVVALTAGGAAGAAAGRRKKYDAS